MASVEKRAVLSERAASLGEEHSRLRRDGVAPEAGAWLVCARKSQPEGVGCAGRSL